MGSESRNGDGYGGGEVAVPVTAKKVVQSVKEIVNCCSEQEIYAVLKECDMDPNRAVERLLAQGFSLCSFRCCCYYCVFLFFRFLKVEHRFFFFSFLIFLPGFWLLRKLVKMRMLLTLF